MVAVNLATVELVIEALGFVSDVVKRHRKANHIPLDNPITVSDIVAARARLRTPEELVREGLENP